MKNRILQLGMAFALCLSANNVSAQAVSQGNFMIDAYASGYVSKTLAQTAATAQLLDGYNDIGLPIGFGGRLEYMASEKLGIGLEGNFVKAGYEYTSGGYNYSYTRTKLRTNFILNYHVVRNDNFDLYLGWGLGY